MVVTVLRAAALSFVVGLLGCGQDQHGTAPGDEVMPPPPSANAVWVDDRLHVDVRVPIVTIGFSDEEVGALRGALQPHAVDHSYGEINQILPLEIDGLLRGDLNEYVPLSGDVYSLPVLPTAHYDLTRANAALEAAFQAQLDHVRLESGHFDANAMEDWLASQLDLQSATPTVVLLHLKRFGIAEHGWHIQGETGHRAPVRGFGERYPLVVLDPSAVEDPWVGSNAEDFTRYTEASDTPVIARFVRYLTEFRLLQGPLYAPSQKPCHAITGIMAVKSTTSIAENFLRPVSEALVVERIQTSFEQLTGTDTYFDLKLIDLPQDDLVLDLITRLEYGGFELLKGYLTENFERFHVDHPGCAEYLSIVVENDAASVPGWVVLYGYGAYDDDRDSRISASWVNDIYRLLADVESPLCISNCNTKEYLNLWEYLFAHETGHLLGQRHPHDVSSRSAEASSSDAFSSIWSNMSYQNEGRWIAFGQIDRNNWLRNRASLALLEAYEAGREDSPAWRAAMSAADRLDWEGVWEQLRSS